MDTKPTTTGVKQYYVAVSTSEGKATTLVELLQALTADQTVAVGIACSSRDSLDTVVEALAASDCFQLAILHADLALQDLNWQVQQIKAQIQPAGGADVTSTNTAESRAAAAADVGPLDHEPASPPSPSLQIAEMEGLVDPFEAAEAADAAEQSGTAVGAAAASQRTPVLVFTDVCLKAVSKELLPVGLPLLIQYDMPSSKDLYLRRIGGVFGASKQRRRGARSVVVDFVVAGELPAFRARERFSNQPILEMPVHVPDVFAA